MASEENFDSKNEREQKFMSLEERSANVLVQILGEMIVQVSDSLFGFGTLSTIIYTLTE